MHLLCASLAWAKGPGTPSTPSGPTALTYNVSHTFCDAILGRFVEDKWFSWNIVGCEEVGLMVRQGFDAWEHNSLLSFVQTSGEADIAVATSRAGDDRLGWATVAWDRTATIAIADDYCWYTDRAFCNSVRDFSAELLTSLTLTWSAAVFAIAYVCWRPASTASDAVSRIVAWTVVIALPLVLVAVYPCLTCYDFLTVHTHEVGHAIGLLHSDEPTGAMCGCQAAAYACEPDPSADVVMHSRFRHRSSACLSRNDVDGLRTLWGGDCAEEVRCYAAESLSGFYRISTSIVYAFAIAWFVVFARNAILRCRRRLGNGEATRIVLPPPPPTRVVGNPPKRKIVQTSGGIVLGRA
jgi:hypothetical protein